MEKTIFIIGFVLACLLSYGQTETISDTSLIFKGQEAVIEQFQKLDEYGEVLTAYRYIKFSKVEKYIKEVQKEIEVIVIGLWIRAMFRSKD